MRIDEVKAKLLGKMGNFTDSEQIADWAKAYQSLVHAEDISARLKSDLEYAQMAIDRERWSFEKAKTDLK